MAKLDAQAKAYIEEKIYKREREEKELHDKLIAGELAVNSSCIERHWDKPYRGRQQDMDLFAEGYAIETQGELRSWI